MGSCISELNVKLFAQDGNGKMIENILLTQDKQAIDVDNGMAIAMNAQIKYDTTNAAAFYFVELIDGYLQFSLFTGTSLIDESLADVIVRISCLDTHSQGPLGYATIHIPNVGWALSVVCAANTITTSAMILHCRLNHW